MAENFRCHKGRERIHANELTRLFLRACAYAGHELHSGVLSVIRDRSYARVSLLESLESRLSYYHISDRRTELGFRVCVASKAIACSEASFWL